MSYIKNIHSKKGLRRLSGLLFLYALFIIVVSCEEVTIYTPEERFVLQAYLYANEPVWDVSLRNAVSLMVADSVGEPVNDVVLILYKNDIAYDLISSSDTGTYMYPGDDLILEAGDVSG